MENKVIETISKYNMISEGDTVVIGVSGGCDSMALLNVMFNISKDMNFTVKACHINHNLRGEESDRDELFVRDFCKSRQIPLTVFSVDVKSGQKQHESLEEAARKERYRCFEQLCSEPGHKLATAHTASDNAETVLINLLRGTGTKGLCGIPPIRGKIIRPLIRCTRSENEEYCRINGIDFVTDSSNLSDDYTRNKIRRHIIPMLSEFNPSLLTGITRMTEALSSDNDFIEKTAAQAKAKAFVGDGYSCIELRTLHPSILSRVIAELLRENGIEPSFLRISQCTEIIKKGTGKVNLCKNHFATARKKIFRIITEHQNYRDLST